MRCAQGVLNHVIVPCAWAVLVTYDFFFSIPGALDPKSVIPGGYSLIPGGSLRMLVVGRDVFVIALALIKPRSAAHERTTAPN